MEGPPLRCDNLDPYRTRPILKVGELSTHAYFAMLFPTPISLRPWLESESDAVRPHAPSRSFHIDWMCTAFSKRGDVRSTFSLSHPSIHSWVSASLRLMIPASLASVPTFSEFCVESTFEITDLITRILNGGYSIIQLLNEAYWTKIVFDILKTDRLFYNAVGGR